MKQKTKSEDYSTKENCHSFFDGVMYTSILPVVFTAALESDGIDPTGATVGTVAGASLACVAAGISIFFTAGAKKFNSRAATYGAATALALTFAGAVTGHLNEDHLISSDANNTHEIENSADLVLPEQQQDPARKMAQQAVAAHQQRP